MSFIIPPLNKPSDYAKYSAMQDEMLAAQIANDANVASARKMYRLNIPDPIAIRQEEKSAQELLADESTQESNVRVNLERIGFRPQEVASIIQLIRADPTLDFGMLSANFPSIEADLKRRFNIKLLTAPFFVEYYKKYSNELSGAIGMRVFQPDTGSRVNAMVNNVREMRRILPTQAQIQALEQLATQSGNTDRQIIGRLQAIQQGLPTQAQMDTIGKLDPVAQQQIIAQILAQTQNLPSADQVKTLLEYVKQGNVGTSTIMQEIQRIAAGAPINTAGPSISQMISATATAVTSPRAASPTQMMQAQSAIPIPDFSDQANPPKMKDMKAYLQANGLQDDIRDATGAKVPISNVTSKPSSNPSKVDWTQTNIKQLIEDHSNLKTGTGLFRQRKIEPKIRMKIGRGISVQQAPTYREFGKYAIHVPQLENGDILNIKYRSLGPVPKFKPVPVSDIFRDFLLDVIETGKPNPRVYSQIEPKERKLFEDMSIGAGVWKGFGLKRTTTDDEADELKRFELLRGEAMAGNNSPKILQELRKLVIKFMSDGRLRKADGLNILMQIP